MLEAIALLGERRPELRYEIVGDGPEREHLVARAASLQLSGRVRFHGQLPPAEARSVAHAATLFVMPSIDEAFGVAYIEAMAAGVPAVGCAGENGPEEIAGAGGGIALVPAADVHTLASTIDSLLDDHRALGETARETVRREFTWATCGEQTLAAYRQALGDG